MTEKEKKNKKENENNGEGIDTPVEAQKSSPKGEASGNGEGPEADNQVKSEIQELQNQLEQAQAKVAENLDGWQRSQAEFVNYKNRIQRDRELDYASMKGDIIKLVLPILVDLEIALEKRPEDNSWSNGIELIARKFEKILEAEGLKRIGAAGQPFDPNFHEAISNEPNDEIESGHVIEVVQQGYLLGERVIQPAIVRVAE
ncbi:MAG: nucleotide exchange factor GrpE [Anaerolineae bacterium]|nr:nucleotide exchange factor GrpE [Anaerolineae bacterium]MDK1081464.1 nucleotide exchange factor GrpE [Anaerolineae bacterium]MDK1118548.1 nucleotide exchange factor GrpE [Anaerolineae bacterium]